MSPGGQLRQQGGKRHKEVSPVLSDNADGLCGETRGWREILHIAQQPANGNDICALPAWLSQAVG